MPAGAQLLILIRACSLHSTATSLSPCDSIHARPCRRFWFGGDTGMAPVFKEIGERLGPFDLAAIPIGACEHGVVGRLGCVWRQEGPGTVDMAAMFATACESLLSLYL